MYSEITIQPLDDRAAVELSALCIKCGVEQSVIVGEQALENWNNGMLIQDAFPELDAGQREFLMSGICGDCFDKMFPPEDDGEKYEGEYFPEEFINEDPTEPPIQYGPDE